jgi:two-component system, OmpR family, sensor histidine kinase TctE
VTPATSPALDAGDTADNERLLTGLRRRLLVLLILPLVGLALLSAWFEYQSADSVAQLQDQQLLQLVPLLADAVVVTGGGASDEAPNSFLLMPPALDQFLQNRRQASAYAVTDLDGGLLYGARWLAGLPLATHEPQLHSEESLGVTWRVVRQRQDTGLGPVVVALADASDPRQQWLRSVMTRVLLPHLVIILAAALAVRWAVGRALAPLLALAQAVARRSPQDLSALPVHETPQEVRPLVAAINRLFDRVNAQGESQRRFVADAAHQLRTPLAGLQAQVEAWAQAARRIAPPGGSGTMFLPVEQVEKLRAATRRTTQLANQLLALSRADARTMGAQPMHPVDLKALCEAMIEAQIDAATRKRIDLGLEAQEVSVPGHEWLLRELVVNLVDNAVKYTPAGGCVTLRCASVDGDRAVVEVEDDGPGIAPSERPRAVERFYRVHGTVGEGTGLGLAIAEEIARVHDTHLQLLDGSEGRGLRVRVELPA